MSNNTIKVLKDIIVGANDDSILVTDDSNVFYLAANRGFN